MRVCLLLSLWLVTSISWAEEPSWTTAALAYAPASEQPVSTTPPAIVEHVTALDAASILTYHNPYRDELKLTPLVWSDELAKSAQAWVNRLAASLSTLKRTLAKTYGVAQRERIKQNK